MWAFLIELIVELALSITASVLLAKRGGSGASPGNFSPPTADPTLPVPVVFGTAKVQPNVIWWSGQQAYKFTKKGQDAGFTYHAHMGLGICFGPIDKLVDIIVDNTRSLAAYAPASNRGYAVLNPALPSVLPGDGLMRQITIVADGIFGGPDHEGGIAGTMELQYGTDTQVANSTLNPVANTSPPYKRLCYAVFTDNSPEAPTRPFYWGTSSQLKAIHFEIQRCPNLLGHGAMSGGLDANPVECIYEILTDTWWGLAMPTAALGPSWAAAAATIQAEGLGISKVLSDAAQLATDAIAEILADIDASIYTDPLTGLIGIRLVRQDYVVANLPVVSPELNARELEFTRTTYRDLPTGVKITFTNRAKGYVDDVATWQNPAAVDASGEERWQEIAMPSITDATTVAAIAQREGRALTLPFAKATFKVDRSAYLFTKGAPFLLRSALHGIPDTVMRVAAIDYGDFTTGEIDVTAAEDVFFSTGSMVGIVSGSGSPAPLQPSAVVSSPNVDESTVETTTDETLTLDVDDPSGVVLASHGVQYQTQVGGGVASAWTDFAQIVTPYSVVITKASHPTVVNWRVQYTDQQGNTAEITGTITVAALAAPSAPKLSINVDGSGNVTVDWVGDPLTTGVKIAASKVAYPSAATTRAAGLSAGQAGTTGTLVTLAAGEFVYVSAFAYTSDAVPLESAMAKVTNNNAAPGTYIPLSQKGAASGVATLDGSGLIPTSQIPPLAISQPFVVASQAAMLALTAQRGDVAIRTDISETFILSTDNPGTLADWLQVLAPTAGVASFNTRTGAVTPASGDYTVAQVTGAAPLASPALTGTPTAPTAAPGTNTTQVATTAFVEAAIVAYVSVGGTMDGVAAVLDNTWEAVTPAMPCAGTIVESWIGGNPNGSISVDVYKAARGNYGTWTKISASAPMAISSSNEHTDSTLTGWTAAVSVGDVFRFVVTSATTITRADFALKILRS